MRAVQIYPDAVYRTLAHHWLIVAAELVLLTLTAFLANAVLRQARSPR